MTTTVPYSELDEVRRERDRFREMLADVADIVERGGEGHEVETYLGAEFMGPAERRWNEERAHHE